MEKLTHELALDALTRLLAANSEADPNWKDKKTPWLRHAWIHMGEAAVFAGTIDTEETVFGDDLMLRGTLRDVLECLFSAWLADAPEGESMEDIAAVLIDAMYAPEKWTPHQEEVLQKTTDVGHLIDSFVHLASAQIFNIKIFERVLELKGIAWRDMFSDGKQEALH